MVRSFGGSVAVLVLILGAAVSACGGDSGESPMRATAQDKTQSVKEKQVAEFLAILRENSVLSVNSDVDLAQLGPRCALTLSSSCRATRNWPEARSSSMTIHWTHAKQGSSSKLR
ncbi:hypothetical protein GCM10023084_39510 [Streptomyces lacrimifluminis]|uniref:Lipoprotein n=1 Tax=Streptomyces lacrimifluminis TaxID=1500077 RepID=A0A917NY92_9ACTN|nr:hypothetical protein GCM10012282_41130 [Streptomyces lacrimifluminis]